MDSILIIFALATAVYLVFTIIEMIFGFNKIQNLTQQPSLENNQLPKLSIVFSALNEESDIEKALLTLLHLNYPNLEIIAINDRSTDKTPEILNRLQQQYSYLKVCHIDKLPAGWFGKNHALHLGAQYATGEWILFTDADVRMHRDTLNKTMSYVLTNQLAHLTIYEKHKPNQLGLKILLLGVYIAYSIVVKPWRVSYSWSKKSLGHGAFNLVNKKAYDQCGGHKAIAMECLDDLKLGSLLKNAGYKQDTVNGRDFVEREWYTSLQSMIKGLQKNSFAYFDYQVIPACMNALLSFIFFIWPFIALFYFSGLIFFLNVVNIALMLVVSFYVAKQFHLRPIYAIFYPVAMLTVIYTVLNSIYFVCKNKGVIWRGTFYPLEMIKDKKY